jgi:hypothetical protein
MAYLIKRVKRTSFSVAVALGAAWLAGMGR